MSVQASTLSKHIHGTIKSTKAPLTLDKLPVAEWENLNFISRVSCFTECFQKCKAASAITTLPCFSAPWEIREKQPYVKKEPGERSRSRTLFTFTHMSSCEITCSFYTWISPKHFLFLSLQKVSVRSPPVLWEAKKRLHDLPTESAQGSLPIHLDPAREMQLKIGFVDQIKNK